MDKSPEGRAATAQWHYVKLDATSPDIAKACFGQPDQLLKPRGSGGLDVHTRSGLAQRAANGGIDGELVAAGVNAELQVRGQTVLAGCASDDDHQVREFLKSSGSSAAVRNLTLADA